MPVPSKLPRYSLFATVLLATAGLGCSAVDNAIDCDQVCAAYADCFDSDYDVDACAEACRDRAGDSDDFESQLESCEGCIEDQSCAEATFMCGAPCSNIVP